MLWPADSTASEIFQISALDSELSAVTNQLGGLLNDALHLLMSDVPSFVGFAGSGAFSGTESLSLNNETNGLNMALKTYVVSESLRQNNWVGIITARDNHTRNPVIAPGCTDYAGGKVCGYTPLSGRPAFFWSAATGTSYTLWNNGGKDGGQEIMSQIFDNSWADIGMLFDGAFNCTFAGEF